MKEEVERENVNRMVRAGRCNWHGDLSDILALVKTVYIYGNDEDFCFMGGYIKEVAPTCDVKRFAIDSRINDNDIVFLLTFDDIEFRKIAATLTEKYQCSLLQIIPPSCFFTKLLAEKKGVVLDFDLSDTQLPFLATIDIVDTCNLSCRTCFQGAFSHSSGKMSIDLFRRILDKLQLMNVKWVELYNFTEPFLHPDIYEFMREVKSRGMTLGISTNLSLKNIPHLKECVDLLRDGDWFVVTISGIDADIYNINHAGGNISTVLQNLNIISQSANRKRVSLRLLHFDYNEGEVLKAAAMAEKLGLSFHCWPAKGNPFEESIEKKKISDMVQHGVSLKVNQQQYGEDLPYCRFIHSRNIVINYLGNVEQCCQRVVRPYDLGSFLEQDISVIQLKREMSPVCASCQGRYELQDNRFAVNYDKVRLLLNNAIDTLGTVRKLSPVAVYSNVRSNSEYLSKVKHYYVTQALKGRFPGVM